MSSRYFDNADGLYHCSTNVSVPIEEVVDALFEYCLNNNEWKIDKVYNFMRVKFKINNFNKSKLIELVSKYFVIRRDGLLRILPEFSGKVNNRNVLFSNEKSIFIPKTTKSLSLLLSEVNEHYQNGEYDDFNEGNIYNMRIILGQMYFNLTKNHVPKLHVHRINFELAYITSIQSIRNEKQEINLEIHNSRFGYFNDYLQIRESLPKFDEEIYSAALTNFFGPDITGQLSEKCIVKIGDLVSHYSIDVFEILLPEILFFKQVVSYLEGNIKNNTVNLFRSFFMKSDNEGKIYEILHKRSQSDTLEKIAKEFGVTRERIRQIEKKGVKRFQRETKTFRMRVFLLLIKLQVKNTNSVSFDELVSIFSDLTSILIYLFEKSECEDIYIYPDYKLLIFSKENWIEVIEENIDSLEEILTFNQLDQIANKIANSEVIEKLGIEKEIVLRIISSFYVKKGEVFSKGRLFIAEQYLFILEKYFESGIRVFNDDEIEKFKKYYVTEFKDTSILEKSTRTIGALLARVCVLVDRGKYDLPNKLPKLPKELIDKITKYIDDSETVILILRIFKQFERELKVHNVTNRFMLHSILKNQFSQRYFYKRDYISKDKNNFDLFSLIEKHLLEYRGLFTIEEVNKKFPSVNGVVAYNFLYNSTQFIPASEGKWINGENLEFFEEEKEDFFNIVSDLVEQKGIVSAKEIFDKTILKYADFYKRNNIEYQYYLFSILKYWFNDDFEFSRPFVGKLGAEIKKGEDRLKELLKDVNKISINELRVYASENELGIYSFNDFFDTIRKDFVRADADLLVRVTELNLDEEIVFSIEQIISQMLGTKVGLDARVVRPSFLPKLSYPWNKYMVASVINSFSKYLRIIKTTSFYNTTEYIIVRSDSSIDNYERYLLISKEN